MTKDKTKYLATEEGRLFIAGILLGCGWIGGLLVLLLVNHGFASKVLQMIATHLISGRAGGISVGLERDLSSWLIVLNATVIDSLIVLLAYPLFVYSCKRQMKPGIFKNMIDTSIRTAQKEHNRISRYGIVGLLLFVWFPLHMTGPLVGAIIGYFLNLKPYLNITVVLTGTFLAVISWVIFFSKLKVLTGQYSFIVPVCVILFALIAFFVIRHRRSKQDPD